MTPASWKSPRKEALLITGALALAGCAVLNPSPPQPTIVDWDWQKPLFATEAGSGKIVFLEWEDHEVVRDISLTIKQDIAKILRDKHKLKVTEKSEEADYFVQLHLRYFNSNEAADKAASVRNKAGEMGGGRPGWIIPGEGSIPTGLEVKRIDGPTGGSNKEWVLLIDVAVGEKGGDPSHQEKMALRRGRLVGYLPSRGLKHEDVLWYFKYGKPYPRPPQPVEGVIPAKAYVEPDPTAPAEELLNVLIPGILPLVN